MYLNHRLRYDIDIQINLAGKCLSWKYSHLHIIIITQIDTFINKSKTLRFTTITTTIIRISIKSNNMLYNITYYNFMIHIIIYQNTIITVNICCSC